ncbi:hypothetical protein M407DRAFT_32339 [Tulasnella calospora MUT 4182]|uniref:F-box domain-containing protein n=1 Tax=Tulasnella calospora MUT 4182 TaxID=1051891 RepID=A0A0C3Q4X9_9AGAM|nr:hypothetical protein M407DRAFT_32339 [Tulasnella calospora MUT 4182]
MDHTRLPPEIWICIIQNLAAPRFKFQDGQKNLRPKFSKTDLFSISLVSSYFRELCQPYIFDRLGFSLRDASESGNLGNNISSVLSLTNERPEIKQWVRAIFLGGPPDRVGTRVFHAVLIDLFNRLDNIESVHISNWTMAPPLLSSLKLERMQEIIVESSLMEQFNSVAALQPSSMLHSLYMDGIFDTRVVDAFAPLIRSPGLKRLSLLRDTRSFLSAHLQSYPHYHFEALLKLTIAAPSTPADTRRFMAFTQQCTEIQSLHVDSQDANSSSERSPLVTQSLPRSTFPKLTEFVGSLSIARRIVRDRPISRIKAGSCWQDSPDVITRDLLVPLMPTVPITLLHLRAEWWTEGLLEIIVSLFPALEDFSFLFYRGDFSPWSKSHLVDIRRLPHLRKVSIQYHDLGLGIEYWPSRTDQQQAIRRALDALQETNPQLWFLQLGYGWPWVKTAGVWV